MKKFFITTAIDYPSSKPHLGHAYEKICADVIARWKRLNGFKVFFSTGLDEHGSKIKKAAEKAGKKPQEFVDFMAKFFLELCKVYNISYNDFIRTTEQRHKEVVKKVFERVEKNQDIYFGKYTGLYCTDCETFYLEKDLVDGKCPVHEKIPEQIKEDSYFFKMSNYKEKLIQHIEKNPDFIQPKSKQKEILNRLKEPLQDLSISRSSLDWGIPVPTNEEHVLYVWMDALVNYLSVVDFPNEKFKEFWPCDMHLIGKDIVWHHSVIWGSILMSAGIELPKIFCHGFVNIEGTKMSKSSGKVVDPLELAKKFPSDAVRYFLLREIPFGQDGSFSEEALTERINNELANDLGNLLNRTVVMIEKYFNGKIPSGKTDEKLQKELHLKKIIELMDKYEFHTALNEIWHFINACNKFINEKQPWKLNGKELETTLYSLADSLRIISILLSAFMPETSEKITQQLNVKAGTIKDCKFNLLKRGTKVKKEKVLFQKISS